jgi:hypothetical protein
LATTAPAAMTSGRLHGFQCHAARPFVCRGRRWRECAAPAATPSVEILLCHPFPYPLGVSHQGEHRAAQGGRPGPGGPRIAGLWTGKAPPSRLVGCAASDPNVQPRRGPSALCLPASADAWWRQEATQVQRGHG